MKKIEELRAQVERQRAMLKMMSPSAERVLALAVEVIEEQETRINDITRQLNKITLMFGGGD